MSGQSRSLCSAAFRWRMRPLPAQACIALCTQAVISMAAFSCAATDTAIVSPRPSRRGDRRMKFGVFSLRQHGQIAWIVVLLVAVQMMHIFVGVKRATKNLFHHKPVFHRVLLGSDADLDIATVRHAFPAAPRGIAFFLKVFVAALRRTASPMCWTAIDDALINEEVSAAVGANPLYLRGSLRGHRSLSLRCRAGAVTSSARLLCVHDFPRPQARFYQLGGAACLA